MKKEYTLINSLLQKLNLKAVEVKFEQMKLDDGQTTIEADSFEAGQAVMIVTEDDQKIALPAGEYGLEDGRMLVVSEDGIIAEVKDAVSEEEAPMEEAQPVAEASAPTAQPVAKKVVEAVTKESYFSKEMPQEVVDLINKAIDARLEAIELAKVETVEEVVEMAKPISHNPEKKKVEFSLGAKSESITDFLNNKLNK